MNTYSPERKAALIARMMPPHNQPVVQLARSEGTPANTLYAWRTQAGVRVAESQSTREWSQDARFAVLVETAPLSAHAVAEYCRRKGLYPEQIQQWRDEFMQPGQREERALIKKQKKEIQQLNREIARKDKALAEAAALQQAIDSCTVAHYHQGCKVVISDGEFKTGALFLHSDMTLEIAAGATLLGSDDPAQYPLEKGYSLYPYSDHPQPRRPPSLINVLEADDKGESPAGTFRNIRIVGQGTIDGNGWTRGVKSGGEATIIDEMGNALPQYRASNAAKVSADGILAKHQTEAAIAEGIESNSAYKNRRSSLMTLRGVQNLYLAGLTIRNPAFHGVMALESKNITLNGLVHQTFDGNNADGVEFGNSQNALVFNNFFDTGDDCVNFAAGFGKGAETFHQQPQSGAWIFNNYFRKGHGAVVTGSHTGAWIEKVRAEDNVIYMTDVGLRMKSRPYYGGGVRDVLFRHNAMKDIAKEPFVFTIKYSADVNDTTPADEPAQFRDVQVQDVTVDGTSAKEGAI